MKQNFAKQIYLKIKYLHIYADEIKKSLLLVIYIENKPSADNAQRSGGKYKYVTEVRPYQNYICHFRYTEHLRDGCESRNYAGHSFNTPAVSCMPSGNRIYSESPNVSCCLRFSS